MIRKRQLYTYYNLSLIFFSFKFYVLNKTKSYDLNQEKHESITSAMIGFNFFDLLDKMKFEEKFLLS